MQNRVYIGLGSNLNQPESHVIRAFQEIAAIPEVTAMRQSSLYRSAPVGIHEQPDFINAVAEIETTLTADRLHSNLLEIERQHYRLRGVRNGPRTLDLDILFIINGAIPDVIKTQTLTVPHPRMHERAFVLAPMLELNPDLNIPDHGSVSNLLATLGGQALTRL